MAYFVDMRQLAKVRILLFSDEVVFTLNSRKLWGFSFLFYCVN